MSKAKKKPAQVKPGKATKTDEAIAISTTTPPQVEASDPGQVTDKRRCPNCGEAQRIWSKGIRKNKDGTRKQKWLCTSCNEGWSVVITPTASS